jgi:hypothetical protein
VAFRQAPTARKVGFELELPSELEVQPAPDPATVRCRERQGDRTIGELEVSVFEAALVIDRDGILETKVIRALDEAAASGARVHAAVPVSLAGASGFRADAEVVRPMGSPRPPLPYVYVFAIAPNDLGIDSGVLVTLRCASPAWPAAEAIHGSLKLLTRRSPTANDREPAPIGLPIVGRSDD